MHIRMFAAAAALAVALLGTAAPIDSAKKLYLDGRYEEALPEFKALHKKSPRDGNTAYYLGATLFALGQTTEATEPLKVAEGRGVADASRLLAEIALEEYKPDEATTHLDKWETALRKNRKATIPDALEEMNARAISMRNMMERVERIEIVDSLTVDAHDFFRNYRLSSGAGQLLSGEDAGIDGADMVFRPQCGREIFWTQVSGDSISEPVLMRADILDDGSKENASAPSIEIDAEAIGFPFLMPDGITLYFAAKGSESLGGYDIFMTRRTDDGSFLQPQNVGMPYNSPANDYLLAIDEEAGIGWWATDRNAPEGKVTIYEFIPSAVRVNVESGAPDLADRARVRSIAATQEAGKDYDAVRRRVNEFSRNSSSAVKGAAPQFAVAMADGSMRYSLDDFRSPEARRLMENLLGIEDELEAVESDLSTLREKYRNGNTSIATRIKGLESELEKIRKRHKATLNKVVRLENI